MKITELPKDLKLNSEKGIQLYNYQRTEDIQKTKINLSQNTISFLRKGTKEVIGDDETIQISNQHFVIMKSGNCLMSENVSDSFKIYHSVLLFFSDEEVMNFLEKHKLYTSHPEIKKSFHIYEYDKFIQNFVSSLEQILSLTKTMQSKILKNKFEEIMLYLVYKNGADFLNNLTTKLDDKIVRLTAIVENNKLNRLSLEELAFLSNMSISTFKREFAKLYNQTPMKWFNEQRLNHVAFLLKANNYRPIELYEEAGYENLSNFVQAFKKNFGMTPKQFQMKH
jgi:AraC-like DNA-binding protein